MRIKFTTLVIISETSLGINQSVRVQREEDLCRSQINKCSHSWNLNSLYQFYSLCWYLWYYLTSQKCLVGRAQNTLILYHANFKTPPLPTSNSAILSMTQNCIWCWGSNSGDLRSLEYTFIVITPRFTLTQNCNICSVLSMGQIDLFKNYLYSIGPSAKKNLRNNSPKNVNMKIQWMQFLNL